MFFLKDSQEKAWFFEKIFLLTNTSMKVVLKIAFLSLSNSNWEFSTKRVIKRLYAVAKVLLIAKKIELISKYKLVELVLDKDTNTFVIHVTVLETPESAILMYYLRAPLLVIL